MELWEGRFWAATHLSSSFPRHSDTFSQLQSRQPNGFFPCLIVSWALKDNGSAGSVNTAHTVWGDSSHSFYGLHASLPRAHCPSGILAALASLHDVHRVVLYCTYHLKRDIGHGENTLCTVSSPSGKVQNEDGSTRMTMSTTTKTQRTRHPRIAQYQIDK